MPASSTQTMKDKPTLSSYAHEASERVHEARDDLTQIAKNAGQSVRHVLSVGKRELEEATDTCTSAIRSKPVQSSLIALGAGFLLGSLLRR